jgi:hypothetical protein
VLVILEGPDGVGKTTLVNAIEKRIHQIAAADHQITVVHRGPPVHEEMLEEYELPLQGYRPMTRQHIICDRWHLGEQIYGPLLRGESKLDLPRTRHIEWFLESRGAVLVNLVATPEEINERRRLDVSGGDQLVDTSNTTHLLDRYFEATWFSGVETLEFSVREPVLPIELEKVVRHAYQREMETRHLNEYPTYVGEIAPMYLLLGDVRNQNRDIRWTSAFVPLGGSSGHYLIGNLPEDVAMSCGIANSGEEDLVSLYMNLHQPMVVALGREAQRRCQEVEIPHGCAPHPQYARRFHHAYGVEYGRVIRRAAKFHQDLSGWRP